MMAPGKLILGIETSGPRTAVGLVRERELLLEIGRGGPASSTPGKKGAFLSSPSGEQKPVARLPVPSTGHNEVLLEIVEELLGHTGCSLDEVGAVGVTTGPGMFSSLRVGLAVALGLAVPRGLPVKGVGTLPALAETCLPARRVLTLVDAHRGQVYCGFYDSGRPLVEPRVADPEEIEALVRPLLDAPAVSAGSGVEICQAALVGLTDSGVRAPSAFAVACLARAGLEQAGPDRPEELAPRYLRRTDAEINRERMRSEMNEAGTSPAS